MTVFNCQGMSLGSKSLSLCFALQRHTPSSPFLFFGILHFHAFPHTVDSKRHEKEAITATLPNTERLVLDAGQTNQRVLLISHRSADAFSPLSWAFSIPIPPLLNRQTYECLCVSDATGMTNMIHLITCFSLAD